MLVSNNKQDYLKSCWLSIFNHRISVGSVAERSKTRDWQSKVTRVESWKWVENKWGGSSPSRGRCLQRDESAIMFHTETKGEKLMMWSCRLSRSGWLLSVSVSELSNCAGMRIGAISTCKRVCMHVPTWVPVLSEMDVKRHETLPSEDPCVNSGCT